MKIIDNHVTRIELSADDVDAVLGAMADKLYRDRQVPDATPAPMPPWTQQAAPLEWSFYTETNRDADGGAVVTITRTR